MTFKRTDVHRPSAIIPEDYEFVGFECIKIENIADCHALQLHRSRIREHMKGTGGTYSTHEHGGNCMVCGNVLATYTCLFYHAKTNTYVRMGSDCTEKIYHSDFGMNRFRTAMLDAREAVAGKRKAEALLSDWGYAKAWAIYTAPYETLATEKRPAPVAAPECHACHALDGICDAHKFITCVPREEEIVRDIVGKLVKFGSISDKTKNYVGVLLDRIEKRAEREAKREAEHAAAADCPTGRITVEGEVISTRVDDSRFGPVTKMLVKHPSGYKVWGTMPSKLAANRGDMVSFVGTVSRSPKDSKFGFFSRPTNAMVVKAGV